MGQKRRRLALSCVDCRRRKVKCDRTYPSCIRCQKGGYGNKCLYVSHIGAEPSNSLPTPEDERRQHSQAESVCTWGDDAEAYENAAHSHEAAARQRAAPPVAAHHCVAPPASQPQLGPADRRIAQLHGRLIDLETMVYAAGGKPTSNEMILGMLNPIGPGANRDRNPWSDTWKLADHEKVLLRGKSFSTQYFGPSNTLAILLQFEDLAKFVREILLTIPSIACAKQQLSKIRAKEKEAAKQHYDLSIEYLAALVPQRSYADALLKSYLETLETTYRIIHVPTFLKEYEAFWESPRDAKPEFVVQLLTAMACMLPIVPGGEEGFVGRSSAKRETATHWINICNYWLENQSQKHVSLINYQLPIQLWLARGINTIKVKRIWTESGTIIRKFMAAGMHREPSLLSSKINTFDCEMRRRLWYTALELDMQVTIDRGMTPTIGPMDWDTKTPLNIDDESFDMDTEKLPEPKPRNEFTRTSLLAWAAETLPFRIEMLYKINSIRNTLDLGTIMHYDQKIRTQMDATPLQGWRDYAMAASPVTDSPTCSIRSMSTASSLVPLTHAQAILNEFIAILHQPFATDPAFKNEHFQSRVARRYACTKTILLYNPQLSLDAIGQTTIDPKLHLNEVQRRYFEFARDDYVRAALSLAHSYAVASSPGTNPFPLYVGGDNHIITMIQAAADMLHDRVQRLGQGFHGYWITSAALSFVHSKQSPNVPRTTFTRAAADRLVKIHAMLMDGQLPRARRMMLHAGADEVPSASASPASVTVNEAANDRAAGNVAAITSVEGAMAVQAGGQDAGSVPGYASGFSAESTMDMNAPLMGFDQGDPLQDMMFGLENMDWNILMSTDPTIFMEGQWDYPS